MGSSNRRADIVLRNSDRNLVIIAECKKIGYDSNLPDGIAQLESYLSASATDFGLFAADTTPDEWVFLRNLGRNSFDRISRSQFESEIGVNRAPDSTTIFLILEGRITEAQVDAIVNPADPGLSGGGGLDRDIQSEMGPKARKELEAIREAQCPLAPGSAVRTSGGALHAERIIHVVGPIWQGGNSSEPDQLESCYRKSLQIAVENGCRSIAFPEISTGYYRYPPERAAAVALETVNEFVSGPENRGERRVSQIQFFLSNADRYIYYVQKLSALGIELSYTIGAPGDETASTPPPSPPPSTTGGNGGPSRHSNKARSRRRKPRNPIDALKKIVKKR